MATILLVEDNEINRHLMARCLRRAHFEVIIAEDGREGIEMAGTGNPDLILIDLSLPEIDGWEATRRIKADPATRSIPIIALTAHAMPGDRDRALEAGCDEYESKPVDVPGLLEKIRRLLQEAQHRPQSSDG
ncbi:MAG: response regulator [Planctomycetota bacterium]|jgi:CheY-like chemotaxis protein